MRRRDFLKLQGAMLVGCGLGVPTDLWAAISPDIVVARGSAALATRMAVNALGGMEKFVKKGQKVVIKPNMSFARGVESATNTHPEVVKEVCIMCKEAGAASIRVLDHSLHDAQRSLEQSGILDACNSFQPGICHHLMQERFYQEIAFEAGSAMKSNAIMLDVLEADVIIAVPVAKSHGGAGVSLSLKGQMGLIYDRGSMHSRYPLDVSIVDLNTRLRPHLTIIDATRVLTTGGPGGPGKVITPGEVIASADPVAADALTVSSYEWYGRKFQPRQVNHIRLAHERGLGRMDIENLNIKRISA